MGLIALWMLLGCGESATFEEVEAPTEEVVEGDAVEAEAAPDGSERAPDFQAPIDARPDEVVVQDEAARPQPGQAWPPIVVPEGPREREWEWEFKHKGSTKAQRENQEEASQRDLTLEESTAIEMKRQALIDKGMDPEKLPKL